jgi:hypothetical protein
MFRSILVSAALCLLAACSGDVQDDVQADAPPAASAPRPTVLDDQLKALEKAKAVGQQLQEEKERTDQAIEDQGG